MLNFKPYLSVIVPLLLALVSSISVGQEGRPAKEQVIFVISNGDPSQEIRPGDIDTMKKGLEHLDSILENFSDQDHLRVEPLFVSKMADVPAKIREKLTPNSEVKGLIFEGHGNRTQYLLNNSDSYVVEWVMEPTGPLPDNTSPTDPVFPPSNTKPTFKNTFAEPLVGLLKGLPLSPRLFIHFWACHLSQEPPRQKKSKSPPTNPNEMIEVPNFHETFAADLQKYIGKPEFPVEKVVVTAHPYIEYPKSSYQRSDVLERGLDKIGFFRMVDRIIDKSVGMAHERKAQATSAIFLSSGLPVYGVSLASVILHGLGIISAEQAQMLIGATFLVTIPVPAFMFTGSKFVKTIEVDKDKVVQMPGAKPLREVIRTEVCNIQLESI